MTQRIAPFMLLLFAACTFDVAPLGETPDAWTPVEPGDMTSDASDATSDTSLPPTDTTPDPADITPDVSPDIPPDLPPDPEMCGNGVIDDGESCDADCPSQCPPNDACTSYALRGAPDTCDAVCQAASIVACLPGDGCCPQGCDATRDDDCPPIPDTCGNGAKDPGESCDGDCTPRAACVSNVACVQATYSGDPSTCDAVCDFDPITACTSGDGCCPVGCTQAQDNDCGPQAPVCGDGMIDPGETCEGNCPADVSACEDGDACTAHTYMGSAATCNAACATTRITACASNDGCCPQGCTGQMDNDCQVATMCGDGVVGPGETCDGDCPTTLSDCNDTNACTVDALSGDAATCQSMCSYTQVTACTSGDGCCPQGCTGSNDSDCASTCPPVVPQGLPYGPASVVSDIQISTNTSSCCFDYTGDNQPDNAFGGLISLGGGANPSVALNAAITSGQFALVFEFEGMSSLSGPQSFDMHALEGVPQCITGPQASGGNVYKIAASSYDPNGMPLTELPGGTLDATGRVSAGPGELVLPLSIGGATGLAVKLEHAQITAQLDPSRSALPGTGVALTSGRLGGLLTGQNIADGINTYGRTSCQCWSNPQNTALVSVTTNGLRCSRNITTGTCAASDTCSVLIDSVCPSLGLLGFFYDTNTTNTTVDCSSPANGLRCNALSFGATFSTAGARIQGQE